MAPEPPKPAQRNALFAFAIAHDLRQPLLASLMTIEGLLGRAPDPTTRAGLELVRDGLRDGLSRVESLLALARLTKLDPVVEAVNVSERVASAVSQFTTVNPSVPTHLHQAEAAQVRSDGRFVSIIVDNLVSNALKHGRSADGSAELTVSLTTSDDCVTLAFRDHGRGFTNLPVVSEFSSSSSGLGLAIAQAAAEHLGGRLWHESAEPGTVAFVLLPIP